jgi:hypothetical protein
MKNIFLLVLGAIADGALAFFMTLWLIGPTHNIGVLFTALTIAGASALLTFVIGIMCIRKLGI